MALIPISHARALRTPSEAVALFRALREKRVVIRGLHTRDPAKLARVVGAAVPKTEHTISWEGGSLAHARTALDRLATAAGFDYLDLRTPACNLRSWPGRRNWVHGNGESLETPSITEALARFHATSGDTHDRGFVMRIREETKPRLIDFLNALGAEVHAVLELPLDAARELTELYAGETLDWGAGGILVRFGRPDRDRPGPPFLGGEIAGFLKTPKVDDRHRAKWHARIDKALRKARL